MGAVHNIVEDQIAVDILIAMPEEARAWISHHFRNSIQAIYGGNSVGRTDIVEDAAQHMLRDLERIGC